MSFFVRITFAIGSVLLMALALALVAGGLGSVFGSIRGGEPLEEALLDALGTVIVAIAVFDVAKYLYAEEAQRGSEHRSAAEARRSLTKFVTTIVIALFLEALVLVFRLARENVTQLVYPIGLLLITGLVLVGLGVFQRLSAGTEELVAEDDEQAEEEAKREAPPERS